MRTDSHANCVCRGGEFIPTEEDTTCGCFTAPWLPEDQWIVQRDCTHPTSSVELVCRKHLRHIPCRPCMKEED